MENTKISVQDLNLHYGTNQGKLKHVNMEIREMRSLHLSVRPDAVNPPSEVLKPYE